MRKHRMILMSTLLLYACGIPVSAAGGQTQIDVRVNVEYHIEGVYPAEIEDGAAFVVTEDDIEITIEDAPKEAASLFVVSIHEEEEEAWSWIKGCFRDCFTKRKLTPVHTFEIYFADGDGNRMDADGETVTVDCQHCTAKPVVCSLTNDGEVEELKKGKGRSVSVTFVTNGSRYYVMAEEADDGKDDGNQGDGGKDDGNQGDGGKDDGNQGDGGKDDGNQGDGGKDDGNQDGGKDDGNQGDGGKDDGGKDDGGKDDGGKDDGGKDDGNQDDGNKDDGGKDDGGKDDGSQGDDGNQDDGNKDDGNQGDGGKDDGNQDGGKDDGNQGDGGKDDGGKDDGNQGDGGKDDGNQDGGKDDGNKDDGNHNGGNPDQPGVSGGTDDKAASSDSGSVAGTGGVTVRDTTTASGPATGDEGTLALWGTVASAAAALLVLLRRKREQQ